MSNDEEEGDVTLGLKYSLGFVVLAVVLTAGIEMATKPSPPRPADVRYITALDHDNVPQTPWAQALGRYICASLDKPTPVGQVEAAIANLTWSSVIAEPVPVYTPGQAQTVVRDAVTIYCPQHTSELPGR